MTSVRRWRRGNFAEQRGDWSVATLQQFVLLLLLLLLRLRQRGTRLTDEGDIVGGVLGLHELGGLGVGNVLLLLPFGPAVLEPDLDLKEKERREKKISFHL